MVFKLLSGRRRSTGTVSTLQGAAEIIRHRSSGEGYRPDYYRVGMTIEGDPSPFILGGSSLKVTPMAHGRMTVEGVGRLNSRGNERVRLHFPGGAFIEVVPASDGTPSEARWFSILDEVVPTDADEWGAWLDDREGMIGWIDFQTHDGKVYQRQWSPGGAERISPRSLTEEIKTASGSHRVTTECMLYAASTGLSAPAPETEYILVSVVEENGRARVEIRAGIDLNASVLAIA